MVLCVIIKHIFQIWVLLHLKQNLPIHGSAKILYSWRTFRPWKLQKGAIDFYLDHEDYKKESNFKLD